MVCCKGFPAGVHHLLCPLNDETLGKKTTKQASSSIGCVIRSLVDYEDMSDESDSEEDVYARGGRRDYRR